jgi:two-component system KDP operon response regulator KdpE
MTRKFNVLIVDDEPPFRKVLQTALIARGFSVEQAGNGGRALELLADHVFHLVLLDINMPGMSGVETCRHMRALMPHVGIIMVTVRDSEQDMVQALEAGADDYITKPLRFGELVARLRAVIRRTVIQNPGPRAIHAGDLEIDLEKRLLRRAGTIVHLTPTEFDLLSLLMKNEGMPLTHAKLLRTIWGAEYGEQVEYLRAYVKTLRKKIEDDPAQPKYILTEPWVGYRFQNPSDQDPFTSEDNNRVVPSET